MSPRARALAPEVEANATLIEQDRRLPPALVAKLVDGGLFHMLLPRSHGGGEADPGTFARVILEIARADGSTAWCLCQASGCSMSAAYNCQHERSLMKIHNLYADDKGESHWRDVEIKYTEATSAGRLSPRLPANGIIFREVQPDYDLDWHPAPRRQYIINLDAGVDITASDGEKRRIGAGEIVLVEDTWGKGHLSKAVDGKLRNCVFVPVE